MNLWLFISDMKIFNHCRLKRYYRFHFKYREDPILLDPRNKFLGARLIINLEKLYLSLKKLDLKNDKIQNYHNHSHKLGIVPKT